MLNGYATSAAESAYPQLWDGLIGAWAWFLGSTGAEVYDWSGCGNSWALPSNVPYPSDTAELSEGMIAHRATWATFPQPAGAWAITNLRGIPTALQRFSLTSWFVADSLAPFRMVADYRGDGLIALLLSGATGNPLTACWNSTSGEFSGVTGLDVVTGEWTFGAMVVDGPSLTIYRQSRSRPLAATTIAITATNRNLTGSWVLNADGPSGSTWLGLKDDMRMYARALTAGEIAVLSQRRGIAYELAPTSYRRTGPRASGRLLSQRRMAVAA